MTQRAANNVACDPPHEAFFRRRVGGGTEPCHAAKPCLHGVFSKAKQGQLVYLDDMMEVC